MMLARALLRVRDLDRRDADAAADSALLSTRLRGSSRAAKPRRPAVAARELDQETPSWARTPVRTMAGGGILNRVWVVSPPKDGDKNVTSTGALRTSRRRRHSRLHPDTPQRNKIRQRAAAVANWEPYAFGLVCVGRDLLQGKVSNSQPHCACCTSFPQFGSRVDVGGDDSVAPSEASQQRIGSETADVPSYMLPTHASLARSTAPPAPPSPPRDSEWCRSCRAVHGVAGPHIVRARQPSATGQRIFVVTDRPVGTSAGGGGPLGY